MSTGSPAGAVDAATATMISLVGSLADNKGALGRRYGEWAVSAPTMESAVAAAAMAQDELGHARSTYPVLAKLGVERDDSSGLELGYPLPVLSREYGTDQSAARSISRTLDRAPEWCGEAVFGLRARHGSDRKWLARSSPSIGHSGHQPLRKSHYRCGGRELHEAARPRVAPGPVQAGVRGDPGECPGARLGPRHGRSGRGGGVHACRPAP